MVTGQYQLRYVSYGYRTGLFPMVTGQLVYQSISVSYGCRVVYQSRSVSYGCRVVYQSRSVSYGCRVVYQSMPRCYGYMTVPVKDSFQLHPVSACGYYIPG